MPCVAQQLFPLSRTPHQLFPCPALHPRRLSGVGRRTQESRRVNRSFSMVLVVGYVPLSAGKPDLCVPRIAPLPSRSPRAVPAAVTGGVGPPAGVSSPFISRNTARSIVFAVANLATLGPANQVPSLHPPPPPPAEHPSPPPFPPHEL